MILFYKKKGDIKCWRDLFSNLSAIGNIQEHILELFSAQSEEVKFAAAFALGNISVGNIEQYLPFIVAQVKEQPKRRYLLLHALKEAREPLWIYVHG